MGKRKKVYIRFIKTILKALKMAHVRRYPHKHDPKIYGVWVNVAILALRQLEDKSYRFVVELAAEMPNVLVLLEIADAPHWTTLHKAAKKLKGSFIERLVAAIVAATKSTFVRAGIDATGLQLTRASSYYTEVLKKDRKRRRSIKKHLKLSTVVDLTHQLPICFKIRRGPASDHWDCDRLIREAYRIKPFKSFDGDKGYTGEEHRRIVVEECHAEDRINVKNPEVPIWRTKGYYLKQAKKRRLRANYRSLNETYHSVMKRIMGSTVRAVSTRMQNREGAFKVLACSAYRQAVSLLNRELFYWAQFRGAYSKRGTRAQQVLIAAEAGPVRIGAEPVTLPFCRCR